MSTDIDVFKVRCTQLEQHGKRLDAVQLEANLLVCDTANGKIGIGRRPRTNGSTLQSDRIDLTHRIEFWDYTKTQPSETSVIELAENYLLFTFVDGTAGEFYLDNAGIVHLQTGAVPYVDDSGGVGSDALRFAQARFSSNIKIGDTAHASALLVSHSSAANLFRVDASLGTPAVGINMAPVSGNGRLQVTGDQRIMGNIDIRDSSAAGSTVLSVNSSGQLTITPSGSKVQVTTELELDGDLNHDGTNVGFYGVTPAARPSAYTQTYSTATKTHANATQSALSLGSAVEDLGWGFASAADFNATIAAINAARTDILNVKQVLNAMIDDDQTLGLKQ